MWNVLRPRLRVRFDGGLCSSLSHAAGGGGGGVDDSVGLDRANHSSRAPPSPPPVLGNPEDESDELYRRAARGIEAAAQQPPCRRGKFRNARVNILVLYREKEKIELKVGEGGWKGVDKNSFFCFSSFLLVVEAELALL